MKTNVIIVSVEKSNKSENNVWAVAITGEEQKQAYCKSANKAMRFAFLLKKRTGLYIEDLSMNLLSQEIARQKAAKAAAEAEKSAEQEEVQQPEAEQQPAEEAKPKKQRKPRTKKVQAEPEAEVAAIAPVAQTELLAFV